MPALIERVTNPAESDLEALADVLIDCVANGASVSFMWPLERSRALAFWRRVAADTHEGKRILLVARDSSQRIVGTVQAVLDMPDNQPHRADVAKMLVHSRARRQGLGEALMREVELQLGNAGRTLACLDTVTHSDADRLYTKLGWQRVGEIPRYALMPNGAPCPTTIFYKHIQR